MSESLFSLSWYRVTSLQPRLRSHVQISKHQYRNEEWYVIQDQFTGRHHRFSPEAYQVIGLMDGRRTLDQIWQKVCGELGDHMPTQDEMIHLVSSLFRSDLLQTSTLPNFNELHDRYQKGKQNRFWMNLRSPMSVRFPLLDPDRFLLATLPYVRPLLGLPALLVWILSVVCAAILAVMHWPDLTGSVTDSLLSLENVFLVTLLYPVLKTLHEFGHGYMVRRWGGEVHEMGIMLLVFMPIPYVDASASLAFQSKYKRILVGGAGIMIELFTASLALFVWLSVEPGIVRAVAFNTMLIGGVSTLLFNGNPLLRFDAYYVLADFLEIPNLGSRANNYLGYLCKRYLLGVPHAESNTSSASEAAWLFFYSIASFVYRIFLSFRIILFIAGKFFFFGIMLAVWSAYGMLVAPVFRLMKFLFRDTYMRRKRMRVFGVVVFPIGVLALLVLALPLPSSTYCEGVTWASEESQVYVGVDGFVTDMMVKNGTHVDEGDSIVRLEDTELGARVKLLEARHAEYKARYEMAFQEDRTESALLLEEIGNIEAELDRANERRQSLLVKSPTTGKLALQSSDSLLGRYVRRGTLLGYVLGDQDMLVRVVVPQAEIERVRTRLQGVEVRMASNIGKVLPAKVIREVPAASRTLPSKALSLEGGGLYAFDPRSNTPQVLERLFQFDIRVQDFALEKVEERVYVRFELQSEPLVYRWHRSVRRLLLNRFVL